MKYIRNHSFSDFYFIFIYKIILFNLIIAQPSINEILTNDAIPINVDNHQDKILRLDLNEEERTVMFKPNSDFKESRWFSINVDPGWNVEITLQSNQINWSDCPFLVFKNKTSSCLLEATSIEERSFALKVNESVLLNDVNVTFRRLTKENDSSVNYLVTITEKENTYDTLFNEYLIKSKENQIFKVFLNEYEAEELMFHNSNTSYVIWYSVLSSNVFDIEVALYPFETDFKKCPLIVIQDNKTECLTKNLTFFNKSFLLRVNQSALTSVAKLRLRLAVSACIEQSETKNIQFLNTMPRIVYSSKYPCKLNISIPDNVMLIATVETFYYDQLSNGCDSYVQFAGSLDSMKNPTNDIVARFCNNVTSEANKKIIIRNNYALIDIENMLKINVYVEISVIGVHRCGDTFEITDENSFFLSSIGLMAPKIDEACSWKLTNKFDDSNLGISLVEYNNNKNSLLVAFNFRPDNRKMSFMKFDTLNNSNIIDYKDSGNKELTIQFYRPIQSNSTFENFKLQLKRMQIKRHYFVYTKAPAYVMSVNFPLLFPENSQFDHEIRVEAGFRIVITLENFNIGECEKELCDECEYYMEIKLNKTESNPKLCGKIEEKLKFFSYGNSLLLSFRYNKKHSNLNINETYGYRFRYIIVPVCNHTHSLQSDVISFNSLHSLNDQQNAYCKNVIISNERNSRIVLYFIYWNRQIANINNHCKDENHLSISDSYFKKRSKYLDEKQIFYCSYDKLPAPKISEMNVVELNIHLKNNNSIIAYDIGYISYKYMYTRLNDHFIVDFSQLIDKSVKGGIIPLLEYRIEVPSEYYIVPQVNNCNFHLLNGTVYIRTEKELYPFNLACGSDNYTVLTSMSSKIIIEFSNILIEDLRDINKFSINYRSSPKVLKAASGSFESFNFSTPLYSNRKNNINYTWTIDLDSIYYIKLKILDLVNCDNIYDLTIVDDKKRIIYDKEQLCQNFLEKKHSYDFATNKVSVNFNFIKNSKYDSLKMPYIKCFYSSDLRILMKDKGSIELKNSHTHFKRDWLVKGTPDNIVVAGITYYKPIDTHGQLIFSQLGNHYFNNGVYHYNIPSQDQHIDNIVSNQNLMKIQYISSNYDEHLRISYSLQKNTYTQPCGVITPFKSFSNASIAVPKLSDQTWLIKAENSKKINIRVSFVDLPLGNPCSKAKVSISNSKGEDIAILCGNLVDSQINTKASEVSIRFTTQNDKDVVYDEDENGKKHFYKGFKLYYSFIEDQGDCHFQNKRNILCDYQNIGEVEWQIKENKSLIQTRDSEFSSMYCEDCFLEISNGFKIARLISPKISALKKSLRFDYKLVSGSLAVLVINDNFNHSIKLPLDLIETNEWISVQFSIFQSTNYQVIFEYVPRQNSKNSYASIDNIQLFESSSACQDRNSVDYFGCSSSTSNKEPCRKATNYCDNNNCLNNGTCLNNVNSKTFSCICSHGYTGINCEKTIDLCKTGQECNENSICLSSGTSYKCICNDGYYGTYCRQSYKACNFNENPCQQLQGHGECFNDIKRKNYSCSCDPSYTGNNCETKLNKYCKNNLCNNYDLNAKCYDMTEHSFCECSSGYNGDLCSNIDDCRNITCNNGGKCIDAVNGYKCECTSEFIGSHCEKAKTCDFCIQNNTLHCEPKARKCLCHLGYTGSFCEVKLEFCNNNPCLKGKCINKINDYECLCDKGYKGVNCNIESSTCDINPCNNGGTCVELSTKNETSNTTNFFCQCRNGFTGKLCQDIIDHCKTASCQNGAKCFNELDIYSCDCRNDYEGANCDTKLNNCNEASCAHDSTCMDLMNDYRCICPPNKYGRYCNYTEDLCLNNMCVNGICHFGQHSDNQYTCECYPGYTGDYCEYEINECSSNPCLNNGVCHDLLDQYICVCPPKYTGKTCDFEINYCSLENCNTSTTERCVSYEGGFKCYCNAGYTGEKCDIKLSNCERLNPCMSGTCLDISEKSYKCNDCAIGYTGMNCSEFIDFCSNNPCKNNATCYSKQNGYYCSCSEKFTGTNCELSSNNVCKVHKCRNGICKPKNDEVDGYKCLCNTNYYGVYCENMIDPCKDVECEFSYCVNGTCECNPNIPYCKKISNSRVLNCFNNGIRLDILSEGTSFPKCFCEPGFTGEFCEKSIYCYSNKTCSSTKYCRTTDYAYECECMEPYIGHKCARTLGDYLKSYGTLLRAEKLLQNQVDCQFGYSRISRILLGLVSVMVITFALIGFLIGHCIILSFKNNSYNITTKKNSSVLNDELRPRNIDLIQQYSIPRPKLID